MELWVYMNGIRVGSLYRRNNGAHEFAYKESWLDNSLSRPISLSLPLKQGLHQGNTVINFFDNLLPDNPQIRNRIVRRFHAKSSQPFDLLAKIGRDAAGALTLLEPETTLPNHRQIQAKPLTETEMAEVLRGYQQQAPLGMLSEQEDFRISIAGAQEKTALLRYQNQWQLPQALTPTTHIFKLPLGTIQSAKHLIDLSHSVDNELICLEFAKAFGLPAATAEIVTAEDMRVLAVKRFDRRLSKSGSYFLRLPHEDLCQAFGLPAAQKYENDEGIGIAQIMSLLQQSADTQDRRRFLQAQVLFYLLAGIDGHAKNFSLSLEAKGRYRLAPLYDILSAYPMMGGKGWHSKDIRLAMSLCSTQRGKKWQWSKIQAEHYLVTAKKIGFSPKIMREILEELCERTPYAIDAVGNSLPKQINQNIRDQIFEGVRKTAYKLQESLNA